MRAVLWFNVGWCHDADAEWSVRALKSAQRSDAGSVREKLIGAWRLAWEDEQGADGKMKHIVDHQGTIVYTRDGHMSVQIMLPSTDNARDVRNPVKYDQGGLRGVLRHLRGE